MTFIQKEKDFPFLTIKVLLTVHFLDTSGKQNLVFVKSVKICYVLHGTWQGTCANLVALN